MTQAIQAKNGRRKKKMSATKRNLFWDIGITAAFIATFSQEITGETLHEFLAMGLFVGLIAHIIFHWKWVVNITKRMFSAKLPRKTRISYFTVAGLTAAFSMMCISGMMISETIMPMFGFGNSGGLWEELHEAASNFALLMVVVHVLQHWKWLLTNSKKYIWGGVQKRLSPAS